MFPRHERDRYIFRTTWLWVTPHIAHAFVHSATHNVVGYALQSTEFIAEFITNEQIAGWVTNSSASLPWVTSLYVAQETSVAGHRSNRTEASSYYGFAVHLLILLLEVSFLCGWHWRIKLSVFFWGGGKLWRRGPSLPPFSSFSTDLGHFILNLLNFDIYFYFVLNF